jgi:hypothetical protein
MSSYSPHASRPSTFRAPGWGAPTLLSSCRRWRNATSRKLVPFSHRSASRIFIRRPGCSLCPALSFKDLHHPCWGGGRAEPELYLPHGSADHLFFQLLGWKPSSSSAEEAPSSYAGEGELLLPSQGATFRPLSSFSWRGRERGPAGALWGSRRLPVRCWWAGGRRRRC